MAIFGKADSDLPMVTQLMQVNLDNNDELKRFWKRSQSLYLFETIRMQLAPWELVPFPEVEHEDTGKQRTHMFKFTASPTTIALMQNPILQNPVPPSWEKPSTFRMTNPIQKMPSNIEIIQEIENTMHDTLDTDPTYEAEHEDFRVVCTCVRRIIESLFADGTVPLEDLEYVRSTYPLRHLTVPDPDVIVEKSNKKYAPIKSFLNTRMLSENPPGKFVATQLEETLAALLQGKSYLTVCVECKNVFLASRSEHRFCSHRCANRSGLRRRRAEEKNK